MSAIVINFPAARRSEYVEVERCYEPNTGLPIYLFEVVAPDGRRLNVAIRNSLDEALVDIAWWRRGGTRVVEINMNEALT